MYFRIIKLAFYEEGIIPENMKYYFSCWGFIDKYSVEILPRIHISWCDAGIKIDLMWLCFGVCLDWDNMK